MKRTLEDVYDIRALYIACTKGDLDLFWRVLNANDAINVNSALPDTWHGTALGRACALTDWSVGDVMVEELLKRGADVNVRFKDGSDALFDAVNFASPRTVALLLARPDLGPFEYEVRKQRVTLLDACVIRRCDEYGVIIASMLLMKYDKLVVADNTFLNACACNTAAMVQLLLQYDANANALSPKQRRNALMHCAHNLRYGRDVAAVLINKGIYPEAKDANGHTVLWLATLDGNIDLMEFLQTVIVPNGQLKHYIYLKPLPENGRVDDVRVLRICMRYGFDPLQSLGKTSDALMTWALLRALGHIPLDQSAADPFVFLAKSSDLTLWKYVINEVGDVVHPLINETLLHLAARQGLVGAVQLCMQRGFNPLRLSHDVAKNPEVKRMLQEYTCFKPTVMHARWYGPTFCRRAYTFCLVVQRWRNTGVRWIFKDVVHLILWHLSLKFSTYITM